MSRKCAVCGKGQASGNNVSHSNRHTRRKWNVNIQPIKINDGGAIKHVKVCTKCLRAGKITKIV